MPRLWTMPALRPARTRTADLPDLPISAANVDRTQRALVTEAHQVGSMSTHNLEQGQGIVKVELVNTLVPHSYTSSRSPVNLATAFNLSVRFVSR